MTTRYQHFATSGIAARDRFDYWRTWYSQAVDAPMRLEPLSRLPRKFDASADVLGVGDVDVIELHCGQAFGSWLPESTELTERLRLVVLAPTQAGGGSWYDNERSLARGAAALLGRTGGWWSVPEGMRGMQVNVPRAAIGVSDAQLRRISVPNVLCSDPVFRTLIRPPLLAMAGNLDRLAARNVTELAAVWTSLMTMLIRSLTGNGVDGSDLLPARRLAAQRYIRSNIADPGLTPEAVAAALRVSRRTLYTAFTGGTQGVAADIRRQRLRLAWGMLIAAGTTRSIAEIAAQVGLPSPAQFSRLFRAEFGCSPREVRDYSPTVVSSSTAVGGKWLTDAKPPHCASSGHPGSYSPSLVSRARATGTAPVPESPPP